MNGYFGIGSLAMLSLILVGCVPKSAVQPGPKTTFQIMLTSEAGARQEIQPNVSFKSGTPSGVVITIDPGTVKQTIDGIGSSFTESSAFVLAHLDPNKRLEVMENIYSAKGANFSLTRTHIGACDFSVEGKYSYADQKDDVSLSSFSLAPDKAGFDPAVYPGIKDSTYDLLPMIQEALSIKNSQEDKELRIIGSAWTAPAWMKDIEDWYQSMTAENGWHGTGGSLKPEYVSTYADYLVKFMDAYAGEGVDIWGLTPVNEPHGNNGQWESMNFTPETQRDFIKNYLGPGLKASNHAETKLLIFDQNRDGIEEWADIIYPDQETSRYLYGMAVHWYESTNKVYEDVFERVHTKFPDFTFVHTEGCIDDLGKPAPDDCTDPIGRTETNWFKNDAFWWTPSASDWAYAVPWAGETAGDHPMYVPVHRYARNIIVSLDHWVTGWVDWNIVLDQQGGPNHVGNFCGAPIMIDTEAQDVYYTPIFDVLSQFSRTIRPGDKAVQTKKELAGLDADALHVCATVNEEKLLSVQLLNTSKQAIKYQLDIGAEYAEVTIPANAVQTVRVKL
jgi:glucosylceramidase